MQPIKQGVEELRTRVDEVSVTATTAIDIAKEARDTIQRMQHTSNTNTELAKKVHDIEVQLANIKVAPVDTSIAVIGGLQNMASSAEAEKWLRAQLATLKAPSPLDVYAKGDFKGLIFACFSTGAGMREAVSVLSSKRLKYNNNDVWSKPEQPLEMRAPFSFLLSFKKLLIEWGFQKSSVRVEESTLEISVAGRPVLTVSAKDGALDLKWIDEEWSQWCELTEAKELKDLVEKVNVSLRQSRERQNKGEGKGHPSR